MTTGKLSSEPLTNADVLRILSQQSDAGNALVIAGLLEDELEKLLLGAGRQLSNKTAKAIFGGMGPLSTFSAKIEVAYMFELIDETARNDLATIKTVRNAFAHTTRSVHFDSSHFEKECRKLSNWVDGMKNKDCYLGRSRECYNLIRKKLDELIYSKAIAEGPFVVSDDD